MQRNNEDQFWSLRNSKTNRIRNFFADVEFLWNAWPRTTKTEKKKKNIEHFSVYRTVYLQNKKTKKNQLQRRV